MSWRVATSLAALIGALWMPSAAHADLIELVSAEEWWRQWRLDLPLCLAWGVIAFAYGRGVVLCWRSSQHKHHVRPWHVATFALGHATAFVAVLSPLDVLAGALFSAHMGQHLLLMLVSAPLYALGCPKALLIWSMPTAVRRAWTSFWRRWRVRRLTSLLLHPLCVLFLHLWAVGIWHVPALYELALQNTWVHALEHHAFVLTGLLWWHVVFRAHRRGGIGGGAAVLYIFITAVPMTLLGALITFSSAPWYPSHALAAKAFGMSAIQDQQLAGLIMWVPGSVVYVAAGCGLFLGWLRAAERASGRLYPASRPCSTTRFPLGSESL